MNKIYKVVWNKARNCYVVASEFAKSYSNSNKRVRSMTAVVAAAMMLTGFGGMAIEAANPASDDTNIKIGKGADFAIWNGQTGHDGITSGYIAIGENAYAWDGEYSFQDYLTKKWSARIGTKEYFLDFNQGSVGSATWGKYRVTDGTKLAGAIAIGKNTMARTGSVMIGDHTYVGKLGDIEVDPANKMTLNDSVYSTTLGSSSYNSGSMSAVTGAFSIISNKGTSTSYGTQNFGATIYGSLNSIESSSASSHSAGMANSVLGFGNRTQNANASLVWGTGNEVTNSIENVSFSTSWNDKFASDAQKEIIKAMQSSQYAGGSVMAIGGGNKADWATYSQLLGVQNTLTGTEKDVSKLTLINGYKNTVTNAQNTTIIGSNNTAENIQSTIVMGDINILKDRKNVISLGNKNTVTADDAVAIGNGTTVKAESGVAIGEGSVADRVADSEKGKRGEFAPDTIPTGEKSTWTSTRGAVSVGNTANNITRQITNVAAGNKDTDAVNVAQLKQVAGQAEKANKGWTLSTNNVGTQATKVAPGANVDFSGDDNITVSNKGTNVTTTLNKDLKGIKSISNGPSRVVLNEGYASMAYGNTNVVLMNNGVYLNGKVNVDKAGQIHNVTAGTANNDAVNVSQLNDVKSIANKGWNLTTAHGGTTTTVKPGDTVDFSPEDTNLTVTNEVTNEGTNVKIGLNQALHLTSATFGDTTINANGLTIGHGTAGLEFSQNRVSVGRQQIHDVADGKDGTDAVNVRQLEKAADSAKTTVVAGKNIKVDADTKKDGHTEYNVSLDDDITLGGNEPNNFVTVSGTKGTIWAGHSVSAGNVIMDGDSGTITGLTNTTWNGTTDNLSRAATEGQLKQVADAATSNDKRLVQNPNDSDGSYQVKENGDVTLRVEDSNKNGYNVTIKDVASKAELDKVKTDVGNVDGFHDEIKNKDTNGKPTHTSVVDAVNNLDTKVNTIQSDVTKATEEAKKHSSVSTGNGLDLDVTDNNGQKDYKVSLKDDFTLGGKDGDTGSIEFKGSEGNITASGTLTANAVSVGNTSISDTGLKIGNKTSLTEDALTIGGNTYITDKGIDANQQTISNVADGGISKDSKDAVNGSQLYATNEAIANNYNNITNLNGRINNLDNRVNKVGAGAAALAALHPLDFDPDAKWDFAAGYGNYRGANAAAVGAYYRPNEDTMFSVGGTFGNGENMVNAGVSFKLGSGSSHVSTSRVAMAKEIKELRGELEAMKSAMLDANAGKKIDTSKLQLFPDVPQNHWAYEYVAQLAGNGMIEGYPDGNFAGDRPMTRYEFAAILYRAMTKGAVLSDKILSEFSHELEYFTVDTIAKDKAGNPTIQRVRTVKENKNK